MFVLGINNGLRTGDLLQLKAGDVADLKIGDTLDIIEGKMGKNRGPIYASVLCLLVGVILFVQVMTAQSVAHPVAQSVAHMVKLLDDPNPCAVYKTFYELGELGHREAIEPIKQKILDIDHWYAQQSGYEAIRKLGWVQKIN